MALFVLTSALWPFVVLCAVEGVPTEESSSVLVTGITSNTVILTWNQIQVNPASNVKTAYNVSFRIQDSDKSFINGPILDHDPNREQMSATVKNLTYNTRYEFLVTAISRTDPETILRQYPIVTCKTSCQDPVVPDNVLFIASKSDTTNATIFVSHSPITEMFSGCDAITDVWLDYKMVDYGTWTRERLPVDVTTSMVTPSGGAGQYYVMVVVQNNAGFVDSTGIHTVYVHGLPGLPAGENMHTVSNAIVFWIIIAVLSAVVMFLSLMLAVFVVRRKCRQVKRPLPVASSLHPGVVQSVSVVSTGQYLSTQRVKQGSEAMTRPNDPDTAQRQMSTRLHSIDADSEGYMTPHDYTEPDEPDDNRLSDGCLKSHGYLTLI